MLKLVSGERRLSCFYVLMISVIEALGKLRAVIHSVIFLLLCHCMHPLFIFRRMIFMLDWLVYR